MDAVVAAESPNKVTRWVGQVFGFLTAVRAEMHKVTWPTRDELTKATRMIVILAVTLGVLIGWLDLLLNLILVEWLARLTA
jgi:preprotein translocase SecE subunit